MEYEVKVNFYLEKEKEEYSAGEIIEMDQSKADDINSRAIKNHPNLGIFLEALEAPEVEEVEEKSENEVEKTNKKGKKNTKKDDEGADE